MAYRWHRYFSQEPTDLTEEMIAAIVCRKMGWTWDEYVQQPAKFLHAVITMLAEEARAANRPPHESGNKSWHG